MARGRGGKSKDKSEKPIKGQMTLSFSSGKMQIGKSPEDKKDTEDTPTKENLASSDHNSVSSRKRKYNEISQKDEESKDVPNSSPVKKMKIIESENIDLLISEAEANTKYKDLSGMKSLANHNFDPIIDAPYSRHQHIPFELIAKACQEIEECKGDKSQDAVKQTIANVFRTLICLKPSELAPTFYFFICKLGPEYEALETGVGNEMLVNAVVQATGRTKAKIRESVKKVGDLGIVASESKGQARSLTTFFKAKKVEKPLTMAQVYDTFMKIAKAGGNASVAEKTGLMMKLIMDSKPIETKFIIRWLEGNLKIGAAEKTVVSALARAFVYTPGDPANYPPKILNYRKTKGEEKFKDRLSSLEEAVNEAVCVFPNYNKIIEALLEIGPKHVELLPEKCYMQVGIPVKPMLAKPTTGIHVILKRFENIKFTCEYKYDGFRGQIHYQKEDPCDPSKKKINIFSRNLENMTQTYPEVIQYLENSVSESISNFIIDCEIVPFDVETKKILPFQTLTTRSRKNVNIEDIKIQVCLFAFDLLYLNDKNDVIKMTFEERRKLMHDTFPEEEGRLMYAQHKDAEKFEEIEEFLADSIKDSCEGLMIKTLTENSTYHPSKRSFNWLKLKKDYLDTSIGDSLDLVIVGADYGKGKRTGVYGSFLLACYDEDTEVFQTVAKTSTGFSDEMLKSFHEMLINLELDKCDDRVRFKEKNIDTWFTPKIVLEIKAADLTLSPVYMAAIGEVDRQKGISLRFPRCIRLRDDKKPEDCSTSDQIASMYKSQQSVAQNAIDFDNDS